MSIYQKLKRGTVREDGKVLYGYHPTASNGELWLTKERYTKRRDKELANRRNRWYVNNYGLTAEDVDVMIEKQNNHCVLCGTEFKERKHAAVDHNHTTGQVRSVLCFHCNTMLGHARENIHTLANAITYIATTE